MSGKEEEEEEEEEEEMMEEEEGEESQLKAYLKQRVAAEEDWREKGSLVMCPSVKMLVVTVVWWAGYRTQGQEGDPRLV
ncbi:hypothetical protein Pmani_015261 [Petrolisthes manimaculis]|uniref:Uncharacterized protein n=1 Tax=Petrolisthes manimaculis TaxID=1843537 RepID=A0AAE1PSA0_9EUCA|nr:hypothetical protein Pmani_015261 [Petrolisthes manimaculis]